MRYAFWLAAALLFVLAGPAKAGCFVIDLDDDGTAVTAPAPGGGTLWAGPQDAILLESRDIDISGAVPEEEIRAALTCADFSQADGYSLARDPQRLRQLVLWRDASQDGVIGAAEWSSAKMFGFVLGRTNPAASGLHKLEIRAVPAGSAGVTDAGTAEVNGKAHKLLYVPDSAPAKTP